MLGLTALRRQPIPNRQAAAPIDRPRPNRMVSKAAAAPATIEPIS